MWKSVFYKEWLKIRWFIIGFTILGLVGIGYIFLKVQHDFTFYEGHNYWYSSLFQGFQYFRILKFLPLIGGLMVAISQYVPEINSKRIKLTFHLPMNENKILLWMLSFGTCTLLIAYIVMLLVFYGLSTLFFPWEMVYDALVSVLPWFLAGLSAYFLVALVVLEPVWKFKILYFLISALMVNLYINPAATAAYGPINPYLSIITVLLSISLLFSAYRFRKGEM